MSSKERRTEAANTSPQDTNGEQPPTPRPPRRSPSTPIQVMARIERELERLTDRERRTVLAWVVSTYTSALTYASAPPMGEVEK